MFEEFWKDYLLSIDKQNDKLCKDIYNFLKE